MADVKLTVVYYSTYGTNYEMAQEAVEAARAAGAEVRLRKVRETAPEEVIEGQDAWKEQIEKTSDVKEAEPEDLAWADAFFFSSPTRYGGAASQMRAFIDTLGPLWQKGELANKCVTAMTSALNTHGGQETTLQTLYYTFMHWGAILVPPGYTQDSFGEAGGNPYGTSVTTGGEGLTDEKRQAIRDQATRLVKYARKLVD
jgi:NAD(P)H dehydrogenase (quinone)